MGQAAEPGRLLRGGGPPFPAACAVARLRRGGGGDGVADQGFPLRPGELGGGLADLGGQLGIGAAGGPGAAGSVPGAGQVQQPGGHPGRLPGALLAGGAAGLAEPGSGDRPGEDLQDGVLAVGEAGRGPGQRPQRRFGVMTGGQRQDVRAGQPQRPPAATASGGSGGLAGAVTVCAPGQAASTARSIRPGGRVPGTHRRMLIPAAVPPARRTPSPGAAARATTWPRPGAAARSGGPTAPPRRPGRPAAGPGS